MGMDEKYNLQWEKFSNHLTEAFKIWGQMDTLLMLFWLVRIRFKLEHTKMCSVHAVQF